MKKTIISIVLLFMTLTSLEARNYNKLPALTITQKNSLIYMYQEEKVARDIYLGMSKKWKDKIFYNIAKSEQNHMNAIGRLLLAYKIPLPVSNTVGVFTNINLKNMYTTLYNQGIVSLSSAYKVGQTIELEDISDLKQQIVGMPLIVAKVYNNLLKGSYNHLRVFNSKL